MTAPQPKPVLKPWVPPTKPLSSAPATVAAKPAAPTTRPVLGKPWVAAAKTTPVAASAATASKPAPSPGSARPPVQKTQRIDQVQITSEHVFQRLRYFENLAEHLLGFQKKLTAQLRRTGTAPDVTHFPVLKSPAGDFDPNVG